jgi:hypothetical protein
MPSKHSPQQRQSINTTTSFEEQRIRIRDNLSAPLANNTNDTKTTMENSSNINSNSNSNGEDNNSDHIPVHGLSSLYLDTVSSPLAKSARGRKSLTDSRNPEPSSPKPPVRTNSSRHASRLVGQAIVDLEDDSEDEDDDNGSDDGVDEEEDQSDDGNDDGDDVVPIHLPIVDPYGDRGDYEGGVLRTSLKDLADGCPIPSGPNGTMKYADGRVYQGHWKNGSWHGHGRTSYPNGDIYEGDYEDDQRHGIGVYQWRDGRVFQGNFRNDQRNGHGVYKWPDGSTYVGGFQEGQRHGEGTYSVSFCLLEASSVFGVGMCCDECSLVYTGAHKRIEANRIET